ncbi:hypothetical protein QYF36_024993 [Acer negundo]|nr:hypothetical protein QYF36_024993 [Acer negundo]
MKKAELIFVPLPSIGHLVLVSTFEFAKRIIDRDDRISIAVLVDSPPPNLSKSCSEYFNYLFVKVAQKLFQSSDSDLIVPGFVNPVPVSVLPPGLFNRDDYMVYFKIVQRLQDLNGIIANTFSELEQYSVNSFSGGGRFPHVYTVGPLLNLIKRQPANNNSDLDGILKWLDDQPECSVHFNAFTLVKELRLSVEIMRSDSRKDHDDGDDHIVMGDEITRAVRCVMDGLKPNLLLIGPNPGPTDSGRPSIPHQNHRLTQSNFQSNSTAQTNI